MLEANVHLRRRRQRTEAGSIALRAVLEKPVPVIYLQAVPAGGVDHERIGFDSLVQIAVPLIEVVVERQFRPKEALLVPRQVLLAAPIDSFCAESRQCLAGRTDRFRAIDRREL